VPRVAIAVGVQGDPEVLGEERDVARERSTRRRLALDEFAFTGGWGKAAF
jgi:hypothetical protein